MAVKLSITGMAKLESANGLDALEDRIKDSDGAQYVILKVIPREDTITRGLHTKTTTVLVIGAEPMVHPADVRACESLFTGAHTLRIDGDAGAEPPLFGRNAVIDERHRVDGYDFDGEAVELERSAKAAQEIRDAANENRQPDFSDI